MQGFLPRATELLKLGLSFFLAFGPFILVVSLAFGGIYAVFGDAFVHGGSPSVGPPTYYDPDLLLAEQPHGIALTVIILAQENMII